MQENHSLKNILSKVLSNYQKYTYMQLQVGKTTIR